MPEKSGMDVDICTPILARVASGTTCCPEAGVTAAANVTIKSKCHCAFMTISPHGLLDVVDSISTGQCGRSEIGLRCSRDREQIVDEAIVIVLGADELPPLALLLAPARRHVHGLVEGVLVLDLDQRFQKLPIGRQLVALRHA